MAQRSCLRCASLAARRRSQLSCAALAMMALVWPGEGQEFLELPSELQTAQPAPLVISDSLIALVRSVNDGAASKVASNSTSQNSEEYERAGQLPTTEAIQVVVTPPSNSRFEEAPASSNDASTRLTTKPPIHHPHIYPQGFPMTVTIIIGASETVKDCSKEAHSQSFLMTLARRFQQLQLLPLLVAIGQQSVRVVTTQGRLQTPPAGAPRSLEPESLLLHRYPSTWEKQQPMMLVEVASRTPLLQQLFWGGGGAGIRPRNQGNVPLHLWHGSPDAAGGHHERSLVRQNQPHFVPQPQVFHKVDQPHLHPGIFGEAQQQAAAEALTQLGGSFLGGIMQALEATPLVRVNLGDMACAALPTSAFSRKLSCWLLRAFADRILCRTAWFDPCQALSDQAAHGHPLLSPVVLPAGGPSTLALPLKPLLAQRRSLPKKTPKEVVMKEGTTYQLLWQALTRLDDMWALAYCGRDIPFEPRVSNPAKPQKPKAEEEQNGEAQQQPRQEQQQQPQEPEGAQESRQLQGDASPTGVRGSSTATSVTDAATADPLPQQPLGIGEALVGEQLATILAVAVLPPSANSGSSQTSTDASTAPATNGSSTLPTTEPSGQQLPDRTESAEDIPAIAPGDLLPGWRTELILKALSPGIENRTNVLAVVGRRGTEVLIAFRGTKTQVEWILNGQAEHAFRWLAEGEGRTAAGFSHIFSSAWPALQVYLASVNRPESPLTRILVTGYSLGGAVAALMSYGIALNYPMKVDAVLFGSPRTGDAAFAAAWARKVNGRSVSFTLDPIPRTPCREMPACDKPGTRGPLTLPPNFLKWASTSPRVGGAAGSVEGFTTTNGYGDLHGLVTFGPEDLGGSSRGKGNPVFVSYNHICSYPCWLATNFNPADRRTLCELPDPALQWSPSLSSDTCPTLLS